MGELSSETLETLVKLAAAGTSGICVVCIVVSGMVILKTPENASPAKFQTIRFFIVASLLIAVVSAFSSYAASSLDAKKRGELADQNQQFAAVIQEVRASLEKALSESAAKPPAPTTAGSTAHPTHLPVTFTTSSRDKLLQDALTRIKATPPPVKK